MNSAPNLIINSTDWINDPYQRDVWGWTEERIQGLASTRALENVVPLAMACRTGRENASPDVAFDSMGPSCVVSPSGKFIARLDRGEGIAIGKIAICGGYGPLDQHCDVSGRSAS